MNKDEFKVIDSYTRKEAIADGFQARIPDSIRKEAGISYPVFVTDTVWEKYLKPPVEKGYECQSFEGRIWDMLYMFARKARETDSNHLFFEVIFQMPDAGNWEKHEKPLTAVKKTMRVVQLEATVGPMDIDDPQPAITITKPGED